MATPLLNSTTTTTTTSNASPSSTSPVLTPTTRSEAEAALNSNIQHQTSSAAPSLSITSTSTSTSPSAPLPPPTLTSPPPPPPSTSPHPPVGSAFRPTLATRSSQTYPFSAAALRAERAPSVSSDALLPSLAESGSMATGTDAHAGAQADADVMPPMQAYGGGAAQGVGTLGRQQSWSLQDRRRAQMQGMMGDGADGAGFTERK